MIHCTQRLLSALATAAICMAAALPAVAAGPVLLTVTGTISTTNRGPLDPEFDKLFDFNNVSFDQAMAFDAETLAAMNQVEIMTDFPKGGPSVPFTGPTLADVLAAAGARGGTITLRAMDGYAVEAPLEEMLGSGAVLALSRDGRAFGIGDFGPAQVVFPRADREDLAEMPDDWWVWQIYHIAVE